MTIFNPARVQKTSLLGDRSRSTPWRWSISIPRTAFDDNLSELLRKVDGVIQSSYPSCVS